MIAARKRLPNMEDRFPFGADDGSSSTNRGTTGGSSSRTLSTDNLPSHRHDDGTLNGAAHNHGVSLTTEGHSHSLAFGSCSTVIETRRDHGGSSSYPDGGLQRGDGNNSENTIIDRTYTGTLSGFTATNSGLSVSGNTASAGVNVVGNTGYTGGNQAFSILPSFVRIHFIIKL